MIEQPIFFATEDLIMTDDLRHLSAIEQNDDTWMRLIVCREGEMSMEMDGKKVSLSKNDILFCPSERILEHTMFSHDFRFMMFCMSKRLNSEIFPNSAIIWLMFRQVRSNGKYTFSDNDIEDLTIDFRYLCRRLPACGVLFYNDYIRCLIQAMVYRISSMLGSATEDIEAQNFMQSPETISEAFFNLLNSTYPTPRSVKWYADHLNKTPKYLSTVIRRTSGKKPMEWITEKTVNEIANLLKNSKKSIKEISIQLNFSSLSFFCRYVRQHLGASPNEYRNLRHYES